MIKWAYKRITVDIFEITEPDFETKLNEVGQEGWELISSFDRERGGNSKECFFIFKRAIE
jgi:hypothetical protein